MFRCRILLKAGAAFARAYLIKRIRPSDLSPQTQRQRLGDQMDHTTL